MATFLQTDPSASTRPAWPLPERATATVEDFRRRSSRFSPPGRTPLRGALLRLGSGFPSLPRVCLCVIPFSSSLFSSRAIKALRIVPEKPIVLNFLDRLHQAYL